MDGHSDRFTEEIERLLRIRRARNMSGAPNMGGEPNINGFEDLRIEDSANDEVENAGVERERIDAGREILPTSLFVRRLRERRERAERDMERHRERHRQIAAALIEAGAENHEVENAGPAIAGMETEGMGAGDILNLIGERSGDARAEEMIAGAGPNREETGTGRLRREIEMESRLFNAGVERIAQRERFGIPGLERSRQAFNAVIGMVREKIAEQRELRERATRIREDWERLGFPDENGHLERSEREALERQREFINEGRAMVRERERFIRERERLLGEERRLLNESNRQLIIMERERLQTEMLRSLRSRRTLMWRLSMLHIELLDALLRERMQVQQRCYRRR
jgi:hypothetical protein